MGIAEKAVEVFSTKKGFDCKSDVFIYNSVLHVMVQKQVVLLALAVYNKMLKLNCHSNVTTYSILIEGFVFCVLGLCSWICVLVVFVLVILGSGSGSGFFFLNFLGM